MKSNTEQLKIAQKYLGQGGARFRKFCGLPNGAAWCDAFVTYIFNEAGNASLFCGGKKQTYCPTTIKLLQKSMAQIPLYLAMPSDVIFFDWDRNGVPNRIGFVRARYTTDSIYTIEGNTSNKVMNKTRPSKYICGIFRPHFKPSGMKEALLTVDGNFSYQSIYMLQKVLGVPADGDLGIVTVKALQKRAGTTQDGAWGNGTSKAVQKMIGTKADGAFGPNSVKALQNWINKQYKPSAYKPVPTPTPQPTTPTTTPKPYGNVFPVMPRPKIIECTRSVNGMRKHDLISGDYILRFKSEANRYKMCKFSLATLENGKITYSNHPKFESKVKAFGYNLAKVRALKTSANCSNFVDGAVGAVSGKYVRDLGAKHNKAYLYKTGLFNVYKYSKGALLAGDICGTPKHTWMIIQGSALSIGCEGLDVKRLQYYLNWYGSNCGTPDGDFGTKTLNAVKDFQKKEGLKVDGVFGTASLAKAKAVRK